MTRIVQCVPVLAQEALRARLDRGTRSGCILEMFCTDVDGIQRPLRFTVATAHMSPVSSLRTYPGLTTDGRELNVHLRDGKCTINIVET